MERPIDPGELASAHGMETFIGRFFGVEVPDAEAHRSPSEALHPNKIKGRCILADHSGALSLFFQSPRASAN